MPPRDWSVRRRSDALTAGVIPDRPGQPADSAGMSPARRLVELGRRCERSGRNDEAIGAYEAAIEAAEAETTGAATLAEALRRLAVLLQRRGESDRASEVCQRSHEVASEAGHGGLVAEALNTLGGLELMREGLDQAEEYLERALGLTESLPELRGRVEQNLGILCNIRGDRATALEHYQRSLAAFLAARNDQGCAVAYHNLGMVSADERQWEVADQYFEQGRRIAQSVGDDHLRALCLTNRVEVLIALRRFDAAQLAAETAVSIFEELRAPAALTDVQRMLGIVFRETGRLNLAQSRFELAVELANETGSPVSHGEALCETGRLHSRLGHFDLALGYLVRAGRRFSEIPAALRGQEVLLGEYPNFVRAWLELLRETDPQAAERSDRVAEVAGRMAAALELPTADQVVVRLAGLLHEVGRMRAAGGTDRTEAEATAKLLESATCFADIVPVVRSLDEPADRRATAGQILSLARHYDSLAHGQPGSTREQALRTLSAERAQWDAGIFQLLAPATEAAPARVD